MASSEKQLAAYRIVAPRWRESAFSGEGAAEFGGRWNSPGKRAVYLAGSRALAALEMLVHLTTPGSRSKRYLIFEVRFPAASLSTAPPHGPTIGIGDAWLTTGRTLALRVPSALIPEEPNFVLNPTHAAMSQLHIAEPREFHFDARL